MLAENIRIDLIVLNAVLPGSVAGRPSSGSGTSLRPPRYRSCADCGHLFLERGPRVSRGSAVLHPEALHRERNCSTESGSLPADRPGRLSRADELGNPTRSLGVEGPMRPISPATSSAFALISILVAASVSARGGAPASALFDTRVWKTDFSQHAVPFRGDFLGRTAEGWHPGDRRTQAGFGFDGRDLARRPRASGRFRTLRGSACLPPADSHLARDRKRRGRRPPGCDHVLPRSVIPRSPFDRRFEERVLDFGTTGKLRHSDLIMYDRQTESWWQQALGKAIVGELTGKGS